MHFLGAHTIDNGGIHMAAKRAGRSGMKALQIFSAIPKFYNDKAGMKPEKVARFHEALAEAGISLDHVIVHAAYVLNCATPEVEKWERAAAGLAKEFERSTALGVRGVCFHPGAATDGDREAGIARVTSAMKRALEFVPEGNTRLLIENTAGAGNTLGRTPEEVAGMLSGLSKSERARTGYGLDTCHLFASGYDLGASAASCQETLDAFDMSTGESPSFFHFNDSEGALASNKDRHALIGNGNIGAAAFGWLLHDKRTQSVPIIMETPQENSAIADDDDSPDPFDVRSMELLRALLGSP